MGIRSRQDRILSVCDEMRVDSEDGHGLDPASFDNLDLFEIVEECTGFSLSKAEKRLAGIGFEQGSELAKRSIWYDS